MAFSRRRDGSAGLCGHLLGGKTLPQPCGRGFRGMWAERTVVRGGFREGETSAQAVEGGIRDDEMAARECGVGFQQADGGIAPVRGGFGNVFRALARR